MPTSTPPRVPLDRERVIEAAIAHADEHGLASLSMRSLSAHLAVVPMALYKHVADKDDLVAAMIDTAVGAYPSPADDLDGRTSVVARIDGARAALQRHPWLKEAIESASTPTPSVLAHMDAVAGDLFRIGMSADLVHHAMHALGSRIWGFSPEAFPGPAAAPDMTPEAAQALALRFPHVVAIAADASTRHPSGACVPDAEFAFTLDLLLDAFERLRDASWRSDASPSPHP